MAVAFGRDPLSATVDLAKMPVSHTLSDGLPVAITEEGVVVKLAMAHALFLGATGSGKGSMLWSVIWCLQNFFYEGHVKLFGLDSKASEVRQAEGLFEKVAYTADQHADVLHDLVTELNRRGEEMSGREFEPSEKFPLIVVFIDEITSLESIFTDSKQKNAAMADLRIILSLGRSRGFLVLGAGQDPTKESLKLRNLFPQSVAGRLRDATETRLVLGDGAVDEGAMPHKIAVASRSNGYATAGVAWVKDESGALVRCRFPKVPDDALEYLVRMRAESAVEIEIAEEMGLKLKPQVALPR